jgi:hypothetical protein
MLMDILLRPLLGVWAFPDHRSLRYRLFYVGGRPAATQCLEQAYNGLQPGESHLRQRILRLKQSLLGGQHRDEIDRAFAQPLLGKFKRLPGGADDFAL